MSTNLLSKEEVRRKARSLLVQFPHREDWELSLLLRLAPLLPKKGNIAAYVSHGLVEIDILPLVQSCPLPRPVLFLDGSVSAKWAFPVVGEGKLEFFTPKKWKKGSFGVWEPEGERVSLEELDFLLLPSLGYSKKGHRLGRGGGYYDRTLAGFPKEKLWGVGFQKFHPLPFAPEPHDIAIGHLVTEEKVISFLD